MKEKNQTCYTHFIAFFEIIIISLTIITYFVYRKKALITGDIPSAFFFAITLLLLIIGAFQINNLQTINSKSLSYYLIANILALLYAIVSLLSKIAIYLDDLLNQENTPLMAFIFPVDLFFVLSIIMVILLPLIYYRGKQKLGVK